MDDIILVQLSIVHSITYGHLPINQKMVFSHTYATQDDDDDLLTHIRPHSTHTKQAPQLTSHSQVVVHVVVRTTRAREGGLQDGGQWPPPSFIPSNAVGLVAASRRARDVIWPNCITCNRHDSFALLAPSQIKREDKA